jgi:hypothetical protein
MAKICMSHSSLQARAAGALETELEGSGAQPTSVDFDTVRGMHPGTEWETTLDCESDRALAAVIVVGDLWLRRKRSFAWFAWARAPGKAILPLIPAPTGERIAGEDRQDELDRAQRVAEVALPGLAERWCAIGRCSGISAGART